MAPGSLRANERPMAHVVSEQGDGYGDLLGAPLAARGVCACAVPPLPPVLISSGASAEQRTLYARRDVGDLPRPQLVHAQ